jgi:hypothetical protein
MKFEGPEKKERQRRVFADTFQVYEAFAEAFRKSRSWRGGMHWKKQSAENQG